MVYKVKSCLFDVRICQMDQLILDCSLIYKLFVLVYADLNNPSLLICVKSTALVLFHLTNGYFDEREKLRESSQEASLCRDIGKTACKCTI